MYIIVTFGKIVNCIISHDFFIFAVILPPFSPLSFLTIYFSHHTCSTHFFSQFSHQIICTLLLPPLFLLALFTLLVSAATPTCELAYEDLEIRASDDEKQCAFTSATLKQKIIHIQLVTRL